MKNITFIPSIIVFLLFFGCSKPENAKVIEPNTNQNKVLVLKVDVMTNAFEGGKELTFAPTNTFTIEKQYVPPADFGFIKFNFQELNLPIFEGTIHWMGMGNIIYPNNFEPASSFNLINTLVAPPMPIFENLHNISNVAYNYQPIWNAIAYLEKVNQYIGSNPTATVKIFQYTPDVGIGNPANWKWIIFIKN